MKRTFKMQVYPNMVEEYINRHENVFSQLESLFKEAKVNTYTIWFDEDTNYLFAYIDVEDSNAWDEIANTEVCKKWWEYMASIMETNEDNSPISTELRKVYEFGDE